MKAKIEPENGREYGEHGKKTVSFARAFSVLKDRYTSAPQNPASSAGIESVTVAKPYQLDAERKRALGIEYSRRSMCR